MSVLNDTALLEQLLGLVNSTDVGGFKGSTTLITVLNLVTVIVVSILGFLKANSRCCGGRDIRSEADEASIAMYHLTTQKMEKKLKRLQDSVEEQKEKSKESTENKKRSKDGDGSGSNSDNAKKMDKKKN
jgi:tRNA(Phe) wybutosine-synthesizing methylase Tyw3